MISSIALAYKLGLYKYMIRVKSWENGNAKFKLALGQWFFLKNKVFKCLRTAKCPCCPSPFFFTTGIAIWTSCPFQISLVFGILNYREWQLCVPKTNGLMHCLPQTYALKPRLGSCSGTRAFGLSLVCSFLVLDFLIWITGCPLFRWKVANIN